MIAADLNEYRSRDKVNVKCDLCGAVFSRAKGQIKICRNTHNGKDVCRSCNQQITNKKRPREHQRKMVDAVANNRRGKNFDEIFGQIKAKEIKQKFSKRSSGEMNPNFGGKYSKGFKDNPPIGKWHSRYGEEKSKRMKLNLSIKNSGENNPMFGKSPSVKSNRGIRGWFFDNFFYSSYELRLMIDCYLKGKNIQNLINSNNYRVFYYDNGKRRSYTPDFLIDGLVIEIKPKKFQELEINKKKFDAAISAFGSSFRVLDENQIPPAPNKEIILSFIESGALKFVSGDFERFTKFL